MEISAVFDSMGLCASQITPFTTDEDGSEYEVWRACINDTLYVLKKAKGYELDVYSGFLKNAGCGVPRLYQTVEYEGKNYFLMEYVDGLSLHNCNRESLVKVLDALINLQKQFWGNVEQQAVCYSFDISIIDRKRRGGYLPDINLKKAYARYLELYAALPRTLCHDDLLPFNVLISETQATIIDWEVAGILPYPTSFAGLIAHCTPIDGAFFYMKDEDRLFAIDYYFEHLLKDKGIAYADYRNALTYFLLYEYCEWIMLGVKYANTDSERYRQYLGRAMELVTQLEGIAAGEAD